MPAIILFLISLMIPETVLVTIKVENIRSSDGTIRIGIFHDDEAFQKETTEEYITISKQNLVQGNLTKTVTLPVGKCGFSALDDENDNHQMDYSWIGIPQEGYGFGNFEHTGFSKPHYEDFEVEILAEEENTVVIRMRYL